MEATPSTSLAWPKCLANAERKRHEQPSCDFIHDRSMLESCSSAAI